jgi:tetratricopeptide (TPR) repeat protein
MTTLAEFESARRLFQAGRFGEAEKAARALLASGRKAGDAAAVGFAHLLLGELAYDSLRYAASQPHIEQAVQGLPALAGAEGAWGRYARSCRAVALAMNGALDEAGRAIEAACEGAPSPADSVSTPEVLLWINVGLAESKRGRGERARQVVDELWQSLEPKAPADPALLGTVALQCGSLGDDRGRSRAMFERSVALRTEAFGAENYRVAAARLAFAQTLVAEGRHGEALAEASAAVQIIERLGLGRYPPVSTGYGTVGAAALMSGNRALATRNLEAAAALEEKTFGVSGPTTASMLLLLAAAYAEETNWGKVSAITKRVLPTLEASAGPELVTATELHLAGLTASGRAREAAAYSEARLRAIGSRPVPAKLRAMLTWSVAQGFLATGNVTRAEPWLRQSRETAVEAYGEGSQEVGGVDHVMRMIAAGYRPKAKGLA